MFLKNVVALAILGYVATHNAQAVPSGLGGNFVVSGSVAFDSRSAGDAREVVGWLGLGGRGDALVQSVQGSFLNFVAPGSVAASEKPWTFGSGAGSNVSAVSANDLLTSFFTIGGITVHLGTWKIDSQSFGSGFDAAAGLGTLTITGTGVVSGDGFAPTFGNWVFSSVDSEEGNESTFSFFADAPAQTVPEGGRTVALLGVAVIALGFARHKLRATRAAAGR